MLFWTIPKTVKRFIFLQGASILVKNTLSLTWHIIKYVFHLDTSIHYHLNHVTTSYLYKHDYSHNLRACLYTDWVQIYFRIPQYMHLYFQTKVSARNMWYKAVNTEEENTKLNLLIWKPNSQWKICNCKNPVGM